MRIANKRWMNLLLRDHVFPVYRYEADYNCALRNGGMHNPCFKEILCWDHLSTVTAVERREKGVS